MKKVGVILSGCGVFDGAEIHESVITLLALDRAGAEAVCLAPNIEQMHVINHLKGELSEGDTRNVLVEAARIARGNISDVAAASAEELDALILPGGFGAAKNLCTFAVDGPACTVQPDVAALITAMHGLGKPLGFCCIAPAVAAKVLGEYGVQLTIGNDDGTAQGLEVLGAKHTCCRVGEIHIDEAHKVISTPAYMYNARISEVADGIGKLVEAILERT